ncbi:MAG: hypothetical protein JNM84_27655 [Planctomycetes bacterium]|nr:hypothetical protein [Planctomycetota bacterium]
MPTSFGGIKWIGVDPRSRELWALVEGLGGNRAQRFEIQGDLLVSREEIQIPSPCFFNGSMPGAGFDDDGNFVAMVGMGCIVRMDLERRMLLSTNTSCSCSYPSTYTFVPAKAGRPALLHGINSQGEHTVVSLDENFATQDVFFRVSQPSGSLFPMFRTMVTTDSGRSFLGGHRIPWTSGPQPWRGLQEIDYVNRRLVLRATELAPHEANYLVADPLPGQVSYLGYDAEFGWPATQMWNFYDLATNRVVRRVFEALDPAIPISIAEPAPWFPWGKVLASPLHPTVGARQNFALHIGGSPGDLALLWCDRAELGGVPITGLSSPVAIGVVDGMGVLPVRVPYDPALVPLRAGDAVWFQGFLTRTGASFVATREVEIRWR